MMLLPLPLHQFHLVPQGHRVNLVVRLMFARKWCYPCCSEIILNFDQKDCQFLWIILVFFLQFYGFEHSISIPSFHHIVCTCGTREVPSIVQVLTDACSLNEHNYIYIYIYLVVRIYFYEVFRYLISSKWWCYQVCQILRDAATSYNMIIVFY